MPHLHHHIFRDVTSRGGGLIFLQGKMRAWEGENSPFPFSKLTRLQADWRKEAAEMQYLDTNEIRNWIVLCEQRNQKMVETFVNRMMTQARKRGLVLGNPHVTTFNPLIQRSWPDVLERCVNRNVEYIL